MKSIKNLERFQRLHELIVAENTGTPSEMASKMDISECQSTVLVVRFNLM